MSMATTTIEAMGDLGFDLFTYYLFYFTQLLPSVGAFLAEMAGQQTGLNGRETKLAGMAGRKKLVQKRPAGGTKCLG